MNKLEYVYVDDLGELRAFNPFKTSVKCWKKSDPQKIPSDYRDAHIYEAREAGFLPEGYCLITSYTEEQAKKIDAIILLGFGYTLEFRMIKVTDFQKILKSMNYKPIEPPKRAGRKPGKPSPVKLKADSDKEELAEYYVDWAERLSDTKLIEFFAGGSDCPRIAITEFRKAIKGRKDKPAMAVNTAADNHIREVLKRSPDLKARMDNVKKKAERLETRQAKYR